MQGWNSSRHSSSSSLPRNFIYHCECSARASMPACLARPLQDEYLKFWIHRSLVISFRQPVISLLQEIASIEFENVSYTYPGETTPGTLKTSICRSNAGQHIALVGASGAGKAHSSISYWDLFSPLQGTITVNHESRITNNELRNPSPGFLKSHISFTIQLRQTFVLAIPMQPSTK